jgi:uncharacterized membrane protein (UPF0127 family)
MTTMRWSMSGKAVSACAAMLTALFFLFTQQPSTADGRAMALPVDPVSLVAVTANGERLFTVEVADEPGERAAGLMFREAMPDDRGMLFVFEETRQLAFWMKNTPMPLDLLFIGPDGKVKAILPGEPYSEVAISPGEPVRYVLELKAGTAAKQGISNGVLIKHPRIVDVPTPSKAPTQN